MKGPSGDDHLSSRHEPKLSKDDPPKSQKPNCATFHIPHNALLPACELADCGTEAGGGGGGAAVKGHGSRRPGIWSSQAGRQTRQNGGSTPKSLLDGALSQVQRFGQDVRGMGPAGGCCRRRAASGDCMLACSPHSVDCVCGCSGRALRGRALGRATRREGGRQKEGDWCWRDGPCGHSKDHRGGYPRPLGCGRSLTPCCAHRTRGGVVHGQGPAVCHAVY